MDFNEAVDFVYINSFGTFIFYFLLVLSIS